ncbi:MAG TPA: hypothetical protein VKA74_05805, partial [Myxococcota bacterium]|nr:hypothetical protein [Myxococcota bacterium]
MGQAQQEFERPDTTFPVERPDPVPVRVTDAQREPEIAAEQTASTGLETAPPRPPAAAEVPFDRVFEPELPSVEPSNGALARDEASPDVAAPEPDVEVPSIEQPARVADEPAQEGPIDAAIQSVVSRLPRKDLYPSPVGEEGEIGFRRAAQPSQTLAIAGLPEAQVPAVERPSLAGLAPLQAAPEELDVDLAIAEIPEDERPDFNGLAARPEPETIVVAADLAEAEVGAPAAAEVPADADEDSGPEPSGLARIAPDDEGLVADGLAEAVPGTEERAELSDLPSASPGMPPELDAELAEAVPADEERPEVAARPSVAPLEEDLAADLAEAEIEADELPEGSLAAIGPDEEPAIDDALTAEAVPEPTEDSAEVAEEPLDRPEEIPEDAILALEPADFRPPETPQPDTGSIIGREEASREEAVV